MLLAIYVSSYAELSQNIFCNRNIKRIIITMATKKQTLLMNEEAISLVKQMKKHNEALNKRIGVDSNSSIMASLKSQNMFYAQKSFKVKQILKKLEKSYLDPDTARKISYIKEQHRVQTNRYQSFIKTLGFDQEIPSLEDQTKQSFLTQASTSSEQNYRRNNTNKNLVELSSKQTNKEKKGRNILVCEDQYQMDFRLQEQISRQKHNQINEAAERMEKIYKITQQTAELVNKQGENIDIISEQLIEANRNVHGARQHLQVAQVRQKKSKKKYIFFSFIILVIAAAIMMILIL